MKKERLVRTDPPALTRRFEISEDLMRDLLPDLCSSTNVPTLMKEVVDSGARGVANARGFYAYTPALAKRWERSFLEFTYDVRKLALKYS